MGPKNFLVAMVIAIALSAGIFTAIRLQTPAQPAAAFVLPAPTPLPDFDLIDHAGEPIGRDAFRNRWSLVFFGFTHCPDICPLTLQTLATARNRLAELGYEPLPRVVLVSVDPERDTPALMGKYVDHFGQDNLGITGSLDELQKFTTALGIFFDKRPQENGSYTVDHSAAVLVVNPAAEFAALFSAPHVVENLVHDLPLIMGHD